MHVCMPYIHTNAHKHNLFENHKAAFLKMDINPIRFVVFVFTYIGTVENTIVAHEILA